MFELTYKIIITTSCIIRTYETYETACPKTNLQVFGIIALDHVEKVKVCDLLSQIQIKVKHCLRPNKHIYHAHISTHTEYFMGVFLISTQYSTYKCSVILFIIHHRVIDGDIR